MGLLHFSCVYVSNLLSTGFHVQLYLFNIGMLYVKPYWIVGTIHIACKTYEYQLIIIA